MICEDCKWIKLCCYPPDTSHSCKRYDKYEPMTNEEWLCSLPTEEKATFLAIQILLGVEFYRTNDERYQNHDWWVAWLKQPYTPKE